jgi:hypothetical protein
VNGSSSFDNRIDFTSICLTGRRALKVWLALGRITSSCRHGTRSRCGAAIELPFQFAGSAQKKLPSFDHFAVFALALELLNLHKEREIVRFYVKAKFYAFDFSIFITSVRLLRINICASRLFQLCGAIMARQR